MIPTSLKLAGLGLLAAVGLTAGGIGLAPDRTERPADTPTAGEWVLKATLTDHDGRVDGAAFAPDGKTFTTLGADGRAIVWDAGTLSRRHTIDVWGDGRVPEAHIPKDGRLGGRPMPPWQTIRPRPDGTLAVTGQCNDGDLSAVLDPAAGKRLGASGTLPGALVVPRVPDAAGVKRVTLQRPGDIGGKLLPDLPWLVTLSPDGKRAAVCELLDPPQDGHAGMVAICDTATGKTLDAVKCKPGVPQAVDWSPDGRRLLTGGPSELALWGTWGDQYAGLVIDRDPTADTVSLRFAPDGKTFAVGLYRRTAAGRTPAAVVYREHRGWPPIEPAQSLPVHPTVAVSDWAFSPDGNALVAAIGDRAGPNVGEVRVFVRQEKPAPPAEWQLKSVHKDHGQMVYDAAFSPDGKLFATAGADGTVFVWDAATRTVARKIEVVKNLSPPGPAAVPADAASRPLKPRVIGQDPREPGSPPPSIGLRFAADGQLRVSFTTKFGRPEHAGFDPATGQQVGEGVRGDDLVKVLHRGATGLAFQRADGTELLLETPGRDATKPPAFDGVHATAVSPDGKLVAVTQWHPERGSVLRLCDTTTGKSVVERPLFPPAGQPPTRVAFSPDGKRVTAATLAGRVAVFAAPDWAEAQRHADPLMRSSDALAFTPDGAQLLTASYREVQERNWKGLPRATVAHREVWVRDAVTGGLTQLLSLRPPTAVTRDNLKLVAGVGLPVSTLAVAPDSRTLVVTLGSAQQGWPVASAPEQAAMAAAGEVRVYVRGAAEPAKPADPARAGLGDAVPLKDHRQMVYDAAFSPDGKRFASIGADGVVIVRDTATLKQLGTFEVVKNLPPEPAQLTAPLANPPDLRLWWRANGLLRVRFQAAGDQWADFDPAGGRQAGGEAAAGATHLSDGERVIARRGDGYAVVRLDSGGFLPGVPLALTPKITGLPFTAFSRDGKRVAVVELHPDTSFRLRVCDAATGQSLADRPLAAAPEPSPVALQFAPDGGRLAAALSDGTLVAWGAPDWVERYRLAPTAVSRGGPITALAFSGDGAQIYDTGYHVQQDSLLGLIPTGTTTGRSLRVRSAATGRLRMSTLTHTSHLKAGWTASADASPFIDRLAVSPDGGTILAPQGSAARGSNLQTAAGQRAKATLAELLVYRRTAD